MNEQTIQMYIRIIKPVICFQLCVLMKTIWLLNASSCNCTCFQVWSAGQRTRVDHIDRQVPHGAIIALWMAPQLLCVQHSSTDWCYVTLTSWYIIWFGYRDFFFERRKRKKDRQTHRKKERKEERKQGRKEGRKKQKLWIELIFTIGDVNCVSQHYTEKCMQANLGGIC